MLHFIEEHLSVSFVVYVYRWWSRNNGQAVVFINFKVSE